MRLTLRTLLAYLDDILEPTQTKELGAKISESSLASSLVNRIRDVMRRRRLSAPGVNDGAKGLGANVTAEYLDNTLSPDAVADVEKACLESDAHLAEVAACHQILTLVLGEPVEIIPKSRERMYALNPAASASPQKQAQQSSGRSSEAPAKTDPAGKLPQPVKAGAAKGDKPAFSEKIPNYLKPRSMWRRAFPFAVVVLVAAVWIGAVVWDKMRDGAEGSDNTAVATNDSKQAETDAARRANEMPAQNEEPEQPESNDASDPDDRGQKIAANDDLLLDPEPPADEAPGGQRVADLKPPVGLNDTGKPAPGKPVPGNDSKQGKKPADARSGSTSQKAGDKEVAVVQPKSRPIAAASASPKEKPKDAGSAKTSPPSVPPAPVLKSPAMQYNSQRGVLLQSARGEKQPWRVMRPRALIYPNERLAVPEPFTAVIDVGERFCEVTLHQGSSVRTLPPSPQASFGFEIDRGRITLRTLPPSENKGAKGIVVAIAVRGETWFLELMPGGKQSSETVCGIEVLPTPPERFETPAQDAYQGVLVVVSGSVRFVDPEGHAQDVASQHRISLTPSDRAQTDDGAAAFRPVKTPVEEWAAPGGKKPTSSSLRYARLFAKVFESPTDEAIEETLRQKTSDRRPKISELSLKALAVLGAYEPLVEALIKSDHRETRKVALEGLRTWLPRSPGNGKLLQDRLKRDFRDEKDVEDIYRLLWGFSENEARDFNTSEQLVDWLDHNHRAVRELAFYHVQRLTRRTWNYNPLMTAGQRRAPLRRWRRHINKEGGLVREKKSIVPVKNSTAGPKSKTAGAKKNPKPVNQKKKKKK